MYHRITKTPQNRYNEGAGNTFGAPHITWFSNTLRTTAGNENRSHGTTPMAGYGPLNNTAATFRQ
jgi:hypothetical protein